MKKINKIISKAIMILIGFVLCFSCNEDEFLKETPLDFMSPGNSYVTIEDFESATYNLHYLNRRTFWYDLNTWQWFQGTDLVEAYFSIEKAADFRDLWASGGFLNKFWTPAYQIIYDANVIIERSESDISQLTTSQKILFQAEARFFRGYTYKCLANLYGDAPIVLKEIKSPKRDYVRAPRQDVYEQCVEDLKFAANNLPDIDEADESRMNKLAASHVLAEVYVTLGRWQEAVEEATKVINHPSTALMTERFGSSDEKVFNDPDFEGDVYWDLFRQGNQDRYSGNTESIWVLQFSEEYGKPGSDYREYTLARQITPDLTKARILQSDGTTATVLSKPNTYYNHRGQGYNKPSSYFLYHLLWDEGDIRNSKCNIIRDYPVLNPSNEYNGMWVIADSLPLVVTMATDTARFFFPTIGKCITPGKDPVEHLDSDQSIPGSLTRSARTTWRKHYQIRLAETYLLRAEAYLGIGDAAAAQDINVVRRRANALDVTPGEVDIDYILDERLRELYYEEIRTMTLARLGMITERVIRLNPIVAETLYEDWQNLWAIPTGDIIKNTEAIMEQNPGY